ncbi:MAG TPA: cytochrome c [Thermoanaerobaculia bacterium]|jgi:cytochrome c oxidase cbb3-type subunit 3
MRRTLPALLLLVAALAALACRREQRELRHSPAASDRPGGIVRLSDLHPGQPQKEIVVRNLAEERAWDVAEGKRLYIAYNCNGCHSHGGGGIGPPLMDSYWIYGSHPENIHDTIVEGRPNGMPSFGGKIPDYQIWEIAAYVRSMSGLTPKPTSPGRDDHMRTKVAEESKKEEGEKEKRNP